MTALTVRGVSVDYRVRIGRRRHRLRAVDDLSIDIAPGEIFGLVGESGSGKSTTGRAILGLATPTSGTIDWGEAAAEGTGRRRRHHDRRYVQAVFQDPLSSLNQRHRVGRIIGDVVHRFAAGDCSAVESRVGELLEQVGLDTSMVDNYPYELSGGQRQRVSIARALAPGPDVIVCDEAVSALDVSTQGQIVNLLQDMRDHHGLAILFISHDLSVVHHISDRVGVMYLGRSVEVGASDAIYESPAHPYTAALLAAIPVPDPLAQRERRRLWHRLTRPAGAPSPLHPPPGCAFHPRCAFAMEICTRIAPEPTPTPTGEVRCHLHTSGPELAGGDVRELVADSVADTDPRPHQSATDPRSSR